MEDTDFERLKREFEVYLRELRGRDPEAYDRLMYQKVKAGAQVDAVRIVGEEAARLGRRRHRITREYAYVDLNGVRHTFNVCASIKLR